MSDHEEPTLRVVDALGHDMPATTERFAQQMLTWLDLEELAGELTPGLAEMRDRLRAQVEESR
jgi:hypothetical protein